MQGNRSMPALSQVEKLRLGITVWFEASNPTADLASNQRQLLHSNYVAYAY